MKKKILALILASLMLVTLFASCTKTENGGEEPDIKTDNNEENNEANLSDGGLILFDDAMKLVEEKVGALPEDKLSVMKIGGVDITYSQYRYYYVNYSNNFANYSGYDWQDYDDLVESFNGAIDEALEMEALVIRLSREKGIGFTEEEFDTNIMSAYDALISQYGDDYAATFEDNYAITQYYLLENEILYQLYSKLQQVLYLEGGERFDDIKKTTLDYYNENGFIRVKHILVSFPEVNEGEELTEEQKAETYAKAKEVLDKANAGEDFDELIEEFNEDPGTASNPDGYYFNDESTFTPAFKEASFALKEGEISGLVESSYGYHIIKRLPIDDEAIAYTDVYYDNMLNDFRDYIAAELEKMDKTELDSTLVQPIIDEANAYIAELKQAHDDAIAAEEAEAAEAEENAENAE
ncbi:MAG: peptidylprolyl isomerase [Clostridia bacterium]|nr:peptidylprolyl isomerase [Clostridia bacterium]